MSEIWKPVIGYEGKYEVSNFGRVKSYAQDTVHGKIKDGHLTHKGYKHILLYDGNGNKKWFPIHRLVASAFIPNPHGFPQVNHKDEVKTNNHVENLEWCTNEYNINYGTNRHRTAMANRCCATTSMKVYCIDETGQKHVFESIGEAERQTGNSHSNIVAALKGRRNHCGNMRWFYC